ncbi:DUF1427 family protein [Burkholderia sp. WSM2232]|uniref:DUF1427 family protein n=1 Tax=Burkholderia sp. WSM2232 TaxID=944436 RepID=UPI000A0631CB|nr:DUF1427 family protein [Burkholderia sp. WSM2232]
MKPYILSLLGGLLAGAIYSLIRVRSPAPPMVALIGLLGMVIGTQVIPTGRQLLTSNTVSAGRPVVVQAKARQSPAPVNANLTSGTPATARRIAP